MKVSLRKVSASDFDETREVESMADLREISEEFAGEGLIVFFDQNGLEERPTVYVYDSYFE